MPPPAPRPPARPGLVIVVVVGTVAFVAMLCVVVALAANRSNGPRRAAPAIAAPATTATAGPSLSPTPAKPSVSPTPSTPVKVAMPNLVKKNAAVAMDELERLGFTNIQLGSQDTEDKVVILASNWTVTKQSTAAGALVDPAALVVLTCTKKV